jgi:uncharacterized protein
MQQRGRFPFRYFIVTFLWSWVFWLPLVLAGAGMLPLGAGFLDKARMPLSMVGAFGPAAGAYFSLRTLNGKGAFRAYLKGLLDFRFGWLAWVLPVVVLGGSTCIAWAVPELWGQSRLGMLLPSIWVLPPYLIVMVLFGGGQEELGWRGYILDPIEARLGPLLGNLVLGAVWAVWHLPLFLIPGTSQAFMSFPAFMLLTIGYSWFFSWVRQLSGKRTLAGLWVHGVANAFVPVFPTIVMAAGAPQPRFWIFGGLTFLIGLTITAFRMAMPMRGGAVAQSRQ